MSQKHAAITSNCGEAADGNRVRAVDEVAPRYGRVLGND
jgi:hypothetical protein